jgi:uncharacterized protein involved in type VI secretion and phage assembly
VSTTTSPSQTFATLVVPTAGDLDVHSYVGREAISDLFAFEVDATSAKGDLTFVDLIDKRATLVMGGLGPLTRRVEGVIAEVQQGGLYKPNTTTTKYLYRFRIVPRLWKLTLSRRSRVFRSKKLADLIKDVMVHGGLETTDYEVDLGGTHEEVEYRAQYRESDYDYLSRVLEEAGVHYYFKHASDKDIVVFTDKNPPAPPTPATNTPLARDIGTVAMQADLVAATFPTLLHFTAHQRMAPAAFEALDADYARFKRHQSKFPPEPLPRMDPPAASPPRRASPPSRAPTPSPAEANGRAGVRRGRRERGHRRDPQ